MFLYVISLYLLNNIALNSIASIAIIVALQGGHFMQTNIKYMANSEIPNEPGIYLLSDKKNDLHYIGTASDLRARIASHRSKLIQNKHANTTLQAIFSTSMLEVQILTVLHHADKQKLKEIETIFLEAAPILFKNRLINKYKKINS